MFNYSPPQVYQGIMQFLKCSNRFSVALRYFLSMFRRKPRPVKILEGKNGFPYGSFCRDRLWGQFTVWIKWIVIATSLGKMCKDLTAYLFDGFSIVARIDYHIDNGIQRAQVVE